jgi:hypothetical protein
MGRGRLLRFEKFTFLFSVIFLAPTWGKIAKGFHALGNFKWLDFLKLWLLSSKPHFLSLQTPLKVTANHIDATEPLNDQLW